MAKKLFAALAIIAVVIPACAKTEPGAPGGPGNGTGRALDVQVASYELVTEEPNRVLVGLFNEEGVVSYGSVGMEFAFLGTQENPQSPSGGFQTTGNFILVPEETAHEHGTESEEHGPEDGGDSTNAPPLLSDEQLQAAQDRAPEVTPPTEARGAYQATGVEFDKPGYWQVTVTVDFADGSRGVATAATTVVDRPAYPHPGEAAPRTENYTIDDIGKAIPAAAVDSRAGDNGNVPDPELHGVTIAEALAAGQPIVVVVSTPTYCQSRFCGPITDTVAALQEAYGDRAQFVHLEVWKDFQKKVVNKAAADWVYRNESLTEPWVFLVGADGTIVDRWANVLDPRELKTQLEQLPELEV